jgi:hypothetical protein
MSRNTIIVLIYHRHKFLDLTDNSYSTRNSPVIRVIKERIRWAGHVAPKEDIR